MGGFLTMAKKAPLSPNVVRLPDVLDLKAAAPLREELLAARGSAIQLDASHVQRVGGLCLQVLLSARQTWAEDKLALRVVEPSAEFNDGIALFGAAALMHEPGVDL
jgi:chemotaxis protein CheX